jgi:hypothetical protein
MKEKRGFPVRLGRTLLLGGLGKLGLFLVTGVVCWFAGWRSWSEYGTGLRYAAVCMFIIGCCWLRANTGLGKTGAAYHRPLIAQEKYFLRKMDERDNAIRIFFVILLFALIMYGAGALIHLVAR